MVTTRASQHYTIPALDSFFRHTALGPQDRVLLIDNDGGFALPPHLARVEMAINGQPRGFAANANAFLRAASHTGADVVLFNNDLIFAPGWLVPLERAGDAILLALSNQFHVYSHGALALKPTMDWPDYDGREDDLVAIVARHRADPQWQGVRRILHLPFYCVRIPRAVHAAVGLFDEGFGRGGAEDIDYRIRASLAGFEAGVALDSYVLHFVGKSTWRGGEAAEEARAREQLYVQHFRRKWGDALAGIFMPFGDARRAARKAGVEHALDSGDYAQLIRHCLARRDALGG
jgi:GT2 family glycosyltransferase